MEQEPFEEWEQSFRAAAQADGYALLSQHLRMLGRDDSPETMVDATVHLVSICGSFSRIDSLQSSWSALVRRQTYDPTESPNSRYVVTFDLGSSLGRVLVADLREVDLADLYNAPWHAHRVAGFSTLWISRTDGGPIAETAAELEEAITSDLYFDYSPDEVSVCCLPYERYLEVTVCDVPPEADSQLL